jgi:hypothetical protein
LGAGLLATVFLLGFVLGRHEWETSSGGTPAPRESPPDATMEGRH